MNVPQEQLDHWRRLVGEMRAELNAALFVVRPVSHDYVAAAADVARRLGLDMERAGASPPPDMMPPPDVPLNLLSTDASRRYARLMREAYEAARESDRERGYGDDGPAEMLAGFAAAAERDAFGAVSMIRE